MATIGDEVVNAPDRWRVSLSLILSKRECAVHHTTHSITGRLSGIPNEALGSVDDCSSRVVVGIVRAVLSVAVVEWAIVITLQPPLDLSAQCGGIGLPCQNVPHAI